MDSHLEPQHQRSGIVEAPRSSCKRTAWPIDLRVEAADVSDYDKSTHFRTLADIIASNLQTAIPDDLIHLCGPASLSILNDRPDDVLALAHQKLHAWPYQEVPVCWRRLYEDASLAKAVELLRAPAGLLSGVSADASMAKRRKLTHGVLRPDARSYDATDTKLGAVWMESLVKVLDMGIALSGAPARREIFDKVFQALDNVLDDSEEDGRGDVANEFAIQSPSATLVAETGHAIPRVDPPLSFEAFQNHLDQRRGPIIISNALTNWPASKLWHDPRYLLRRTLGGRRLVPVEKGKQYTDEGWSQSIMPFHEFLQKYLLPENAEEVGYLAQHDLFAQLPSLKADVIVPDYCYTSPPPPLPNSAQARTAGLEKVQLLEEPLLNAWLGPKGTRTPMHTDPYHNVLYQIVGYKYVRLYAPEQTPALYPRGVDDKGINMNNTSQIDLSAVRGGDATALEELETVFPLFKDAQFVEDILGPSECLYVPLGWWHYVESLSVSFSVSFWWN